MIGTMGDRSSFLDRFLDSRSSSSSPSASTVASASRQASNSNLRPQQITPRSRLSLQRGSSCSCCLRLDTRWSAKRFRAPRAMYRFSYEARWMLGTSLTLEKQYIDALRFDDYVLADYRFGDGQPVICMPPTIGRREKAIGALSSGCLPGGVWEISSIHSMDLRRTPGWFGRCM